ncbi:MAG: carboxyl transferase domain-containing protein [Butyrivibrio sp.]|nr:carboxyl transferase domain-containing protein [Butyrivibrio sp.]
MSTTTQVLAGKRIESLLDDGSFVEIGALVTARSTDFNMAENDTPADGVITGFGTIEGQLVYVYSQDATVLSGSIGEMHAKKIVNLYDMAMKMGAPVIGLLDCAGIRLQEATDALNAFGEIYLKQSMASGVIPQITAIFGNCGGGLALMPSLTDFTFMETKNGKLFVNSPNTLDGNKTEDTASAAFQSEQAGIVDFTGDEASILAQIRELVAILPVNFEDEAVEECADDLNRVCEGLEAGKNDPAFVFATISDNNVFVETRKSFAKEMVTGFIKLNGATVGVVGNRTELFEDGNSVETFDAVLTSGGCYKAAEFVNFCDAFSIPVLSYTNTKGFAATIANEKSISKAAAKLTYAFANASVPKVNVIAGEAFGSAYVAMNSKAIGADMTYAWPDAVIGTMEPELAAKIMYASQPELIDAKAAEYASLQSSATSAAKRGYVDSIIEPADTRKYAIGAFEMLYSKKIDTVAKKHGTV